MTNIAFLILHHSAVSYKKNPDQWLANNKYHEQKWHLKSSLGYYLGYNYEISMAGILRQARSEGEETVAVVGHNYDSISVCMDGEFDTELPTPEQVASLTKLLLELKGRYPNAKIAYHRQFANKTCPGKLIADNWANNLINQPNLENMQYIIVGGKEQYLLYDKPNMALGIGDASELVALRANGLTGDPVPMDRVPAGYTVYPLTRKDRFKEELDKLRLNFNKIIDLLGV